MKVEMRIRIIWTLGAIAALSVALLVIRYALFEIHGMMQWPIALFLFGLVVIGISAIVGSQKVMIGTVTGYVAGFVLGMVIFPDVSRFDLNSGHDVYYGWAIWLGSFLFTIVVSIIWTLVSRKRS